MQHEWIRFIPFGIFTLMAVWFVTVFFASVVNMGSVPGFAASVMLAFCSLRFDLVKKAVAALQHSLGGKILLWGISALLAVIVLVALTFTVLMVHQANRTPKQHDLPIIVLGCKVNDEVPSRMLRYRLQTAVAYMEEHPDAICVVSGGQGWNESRTEAGVMQRWMSAGGIDASRIIIEDRSMNTEQNLLFSKEMLENAGISCEKAIIVTDGYHQYRASLFAKKIDIDAYAVSANTDWHLVPTYWIREWFGLCKYFVFG